jgi:hypothetical protein
VSPSREFHTLAPCFWNCLGISPSNTDDLSFLQFSVCVKNFVLFFILHLKNAPTLSTEDFSPLVYDTFQCGRNMRMLRKISVFWYMTPFSVVEICECYGRFLSFGI